MDERTIIDKLNNKDLTIIENKIKELSKSTFRTSFHLNKKEIEYINKNGLNKVEQHAYEFIKKNLAPSNIPNDGKQTPTHNHPVFPARHATATCCRGCLEKWHHIKKGKELTDNEIKYIISIIMYWIVKEVNK
jgi:exodeoxyribonuclease V alpha subunit